MRKYVGKVLKLYVDESFIDEMYIISMVVCNIKSSEFWANEFKNVCNSKNLTNLHGNELSGSRNKQDAASLFLSKLNMRRKDGKYRDNGLAFSIFGLHRDPQKEREIWGNNATVKFYGRLLQSQIGHSLKKFCNHYPSSPVTLAKLYHHQKSQLENDIGFSEFVLKNTLERFNIEHLFDEKVQFLSSDFAETNSLESYLIQLADLLAWLTQKGIKGVTSSKNDTKEKMPFIFHSWQNNLLAPMLCDYNDIHTLDADNDEKTEIWNKWFWSHIAFFPDDNGLCYTPKSTIFRYTPT